jgi:ADP-heptose:LPS heptosyltransferase
MGDTLWGTPAIRAVKKKFPQVSIDLLIQPQWIALFKKIKIFAIQYPIIQSGIVKYSCYQTF